MSEHQDKSIRRALFFAAFMFLIFGILTWINGTLIAFFQKSFDLSHFDSYLVTFAYYLSYTVMALPSSIVLRKVGFKNGMVIGLLIMSLGCLVFIPASLIASYVIFLVGLFITGIGLTLLQTAVNPYVTLMGPHESGAKRVSIMGFSNKIGGIIGQVIFGSILLHEASTIIQQDELRKIIVPYLFLTGLFILLSFIVKKSDWFPEIANNEPKTKECDIKENGKKYIFQYPNLVLGVIALFSAGAVEVMAIDSIISYGLAIGFPIKIAKLFGSYFHVIYI